MTRRTESLAIVALVVVLAALGSTWWIDDTSGVGWSGFGCGVVIGLPLLLWRDRPSWTLLLMGTAVTAFAAAGIAPPFLSTPVMTAGAFVAGERFSGRAAWIIGVTALLWGQGIYLLTGEDNPAFAIFTVPGYVVGVALRLRRQTAEQLAIRARELEDERELFAQLSVRNERARIASELHDVIGHALSVVVVQSAAGQRLVDRDDAAAADALAAIADSTRQGREDLRRLIDLLEGEQVTAPDLSLVDELVARAGASGLQVSCRFEGDRDGVPAPLAGVAFRVVQESLTNALRYAPGAAVQVLLQGDRRRLRVLVENDAPHGAATGLRGGGTGLAGLRDRVAEVGGTLRFGPSASGGWTVEASLGR